LVFDTNQGNISVAEDSRAYVLPPSEIGEGLKTARRALAPSSRDQVENGDFCFFEKEK
jgi:hypothetical protein